MSKEIINKVVDETVDTIIDKIDEVLVDYMDEYGDYEKSLVIGDDRFYNDHVKMFGQVIKELNNRINNLK